MYEYVAEGEKYLGKHPQHTRRDAHKSKRATYTHTVRALVSSGDAMVIDRTLQAVREQVFEHHAEAERTALRQAAVVQG